MGSRWRPVVSALLPAVLVGPLLVGALLVGGPVGAAVRDGSTRSRAANAPGADVAGEVTPVVDPLGGRRIVLMGDSLASGLADPMATVAPGAVVGDARSGCGWVDALVVHTPNRALSQWCVDDDEAYLARVAQKARDADAVVLLSSWENNDHVVGGQVLSFATPEWDAWFLAQLESLRVRLGTRLVLATVPLGGPAYDRAGDRFVYTQDESDQARLDHIADLYRVFAAAHDTDVSVVDLNRIVCPQRYPCPGRLDGVVLRPTDGAHPSPEGAAWEAPRFLTMIGATLAAQDWVRRPRVLAPSEGATARRSPTTAS